MVLIPYEEVQNNERSDNDIKSTKGLLRDLNINMNSVLNNKSLSDERKIFLYNQLQRKYRFLMNELDKEKNLQVNKLIEVLKKPQQHFLSPMSSRKQTTTKKIEIPKGTFIGSRQHPLTQSLLDTSPIKIDDDEDLDRDLLNSQALLGSNQGFENIDDISVNQEGFSTPSSSSVYPLPSFDDPVSVATPSTSRSFPSNRLSHRRNAIDHIQDMNTNRKPYYQTRSQLQKIKEEQFDDDDGESRRQKGHGIRSWSHLK